jgi:hypothetical protein
MLTDVQDDRCQANLEKAACMTLWKMTPRISSEPTSPNNLLVGTNNVCEVLYKISSFCLDLTKNMAAMGNYRL